MATKRTIELSNLSVEELANEINKLTGDYSKMKFDHAVKGLSNPNELVAMRREIARLKTESRKRELASMSSDDLKKRSKLVLRRRLQKHN